MGNLSAVHIRNLVSNGEAVTKSDGDGLTFTMSAAQAKAMSATWVLRYRFGGKSRELTIGRYPDLSLAKARDLAIQERAKIQQGADVAVEKQRSKQQSARAWTVRRLADDYLEKITGRLAPSTVAQRRQQLRDHVVSVIGARPAADVTPPDIVDIAEAAAAKSIHVARLVLMALRELFAHAVARHVIEANPCAHVTSKAVIGPRPVNRTRIMLNEYELRAMLPALPSIGRSNELAVKVLLATCTRIGELMLAEWSHMDLERREWAIPPELSKNRKRFVIPLTEPVVGWFLELQTIAFGSRFVLPIRKRHDDVGGDRPMEPSTLNAAINRLCRDLGDQCRRFTPHDLRSTARSHLGAMGVDLLVAERCLNHSLGGLVAVYDQHDYLTERRAALERWATFLQACEAGGTWNSVAIRHRIA